MNVVNKVAVMADSTCCLPQELLDTYDIYLLPVHILYEGKSYRDKLDISPGEVYRIMRKKGSLPTTSTPSAGEFLQAYRQLSQKAESIVCITVTSLQSQTFGTAVLAKQLARESNLNTTIEVFDSRAVAGSLGFISLAAAKIASKGGELADVVGAARIMQSKVNGVFMLDTLYYLARTGRVARAAAWVGDALNIKPVVEHSTAIGETTPLARPRDKEKAVELMMQTMVERVKTARVHVMVHHADELEAASKLMKRIESQLNCDELYITEFTPGMGVHCGPGMLGVTFYTD
jgi:DegV family protein with EDD domain